MFIKKIAIQNFRIFSNDAVFTVDGLNVPDGQNEGSGLTVFVGENGCGKTSLLEAVSMPLLPFKAESFLLKDLNDVGNKTIVEITSSSEFEVKKVVKGSFRSKGFMFEGGMRARGSSSHLDSLTTTYRYYIRADGESVDERSTDLRVDVDNPWSGPRFNDFVVRYIDKNRTYQIKSGTYNSTVFDRLMEDFNYQYLARDEDDDDLEDISEELGRKVIPRTEHALLEAAVEKFREITGISIGVELINNYQPFSNAFFGEKKSNLLQIELNRLGSGYEMIFSLLYSFYLSQQAGKDLIILIDEPELHLHPELQGKMVDILLTLSKSAQILISTQSPLLVKQTMHNEEVLVQVLKRNNNSVELVNPDDRVLPYLSANEINYVAFGLPTEEYHNELYEELLINNSQSQQVAPKIKPFDVRFFQQSKGEPASYPYLGNPNEVSLHTHIRTQIHHRGTAGKPDVNDIKTSIDKMRSFF